VKTLAQSIINATAGAFDKAVTSAVRRAQQGRARAQVRSHAERLAAIEGLRRAYEGLVPSGDEARIFPAPPPVDPRLRQVRKAPSGASVVDAEWPSPYEPLFDELRPRYLECRENRTAHARLFLHAEPRPAVVLVHGYLGGHYRFEEFAFSLPWLCRLGFDVALFVLPFHARRAAPGRAGAPPFPGVDPRYTIEGFRQAMGDLRGLTAWLRARGAPSVGVMGMSLGGYTTALAATLDPELSFAVPFIPLACFADLARDAGRHGVTPNEAALEYAALSAFYAPVSPLARSSRLPSRRVLVVGAQGDTITPLHHAERLAAHFGSPLVSFTGGHLMQIGARGAWRQVKAFWRDLGVIAPSTSAAPVRRLERT
jgi:pimeloyl-ACP methyl ester carboxylesterase